MLWGEIKVDFDDLKHIDHRNRGFIELYNTIMTCLGDLGLLFAVPPLGAKWFGQEVGREVDHKRFMRRAVYRSKAREEALNLVADGNS